MVWGRPPYIRNREDGVSDITPLFIVYKVLVKVRGLDLHPGHSPGPRTCANSLGLLGSVTSAFGSRGRIYVASRFRPRQIGLGIYARVLSVSLLVVGVGVHVGVVVGVGVGVGVGIGVGVVVGVGVGVVVGVGGGVGAGEGHIFDLLANMRKV